MTNNPYIGPRTFSEAEAHLFFGREREARDLLSLVLAERLILFHAPSGAGKSSLMQTRLRPQLAKERFDVSLPVARVSGELPPDITAVNNIFTFNLILSLDQNRYPAHELTDLTLSDYLTKRVTSAANMPFVLIIDQFEEILTTNPQHWAQRQPFFEQLRQAMSDHEALWVVLAMREDYVAALEPYSHLLPNRLRTRYAMQRLSYQAALQAVSKPATAAGRPFAPGVAEQLVDNLRQIKVQAFGENQTVLGEFVEPVQLQVVCYRLWERLTESKSLDLRNKSKDLDSMSDSISMADLADLGDVDKALADFYEQILAETLAHQAVDEITLRDWFDHELITEANTRGTVYQGEETTGELANQVVHFLVKKFIIRAEIRAGGTWIELVHDRFIGPILQANLAWRQKQPLLQRAQSWVEADYAASHLLEGQALQETLASNWQGLGELVQQYMEASQKLQLEKERLRQEAKFKAEEARRQQIERYNKQLRLRARWLMVLALIALIMAVIAVWFGWQAQQNEKIAKIEKSVAVHSQETLVAANILLVTALVSTPTPVSISSIGKRTVKIGVVGRNSETFEELDYQVIRQARLESIVLMSQVIPQVAERIQKENPGIEIIVWLYDDRVSSGHHPTPAEFAERMIPIMRDYQPYSQKFYLLHEPNHLHRYEGWGSTDDDAKDFNTWFLEAYDRLKQAHPWAKLGFPPLAIPDFGHRDRAWLNICRPAIEKADWLAVEAYWQSPPGQPSVMFHESFGLNFKYYHQQYPGKEINIVEAGNMNVQNKFPISEEDIVRENIEWLQEVFNYPYINSANLVLLSSQDKGNWETLVWRTEDGTIKSIVKEIAQLPRPKLVPLEFAPPAPTIESSVVTEIQTKITNQNIIDVFYSVGKALSIEPAPWGLLNRSGLILGDLIGNRDDVFMGNLNKLNLTLVERLAIQTKLIEMGINDTQTGITNQNMIDAIYQAGKTLGLPDWSLLGKADLSLAELASQREGLFTGDITQLSPIEQQAVQTELFKLLGIEIQVTPTLAITLTPTLKSTQTVIPTPKPTVNVIATEIAVAQATNESQISVNCPNGPDNQFQELWTKYKTRLGCPKQLGYPIDNGLFVEQLFEHGFMFWSERYKDKFVIAINTTKQTVWYLGTWTNEQDCVSEVPLRNAMELVWCDKNQPIQNAMGKPIAIERGIGGGIQEFENGIILRDNNIENAYVLFNDGTVIMPPAHLDLVLEYFKQHGYIYQWNGQSQGSAKIIDLQIDGANAMLKYEGTQNGVLRGLLRGNTLKGGWQSNDNGQGQFELTFSPDFATATGTYGGAEVWEDLPGHHELK